MPPGRKIPGSGKDWKKGQSGNPGGKPAIASPELREVLKKNREAFLIEATSLYALKAEEIAAVAKDPEVPFLRSALSRVMTMMLNKGCEKRLGFLVEQTMVSLPKTIELSDIDGKPIRPLSGVPTDKLLEFMEALISKKS